jgi:sirohydrochlorin ferrochelatase
MKASERVALVVAAHGDRGSADRNAALKAHTRRIGERNLFAGVFCGVLNGEPDLAKALREAEEASCERILVYPFFMSGGYFVDIKLRERIAAAKLCASVHVLRPLGLDPALAGLLLERSIHAACASGFEVGRTALLVGGHGSKRRGASAEATEAAARFMRTHSPFLEVATAFIEEKPLVCDTLARLSAPTVIACFFSGEGLHGGHDVPAAMRRARAPCVYTRPIGTDPAIAVLIEDAALAALANLPA